MQEVSSHKLNASTLFDAGPSSRLDTFSDRGSDIGANPPMHTHGIADDEDTELLETARSLSLTYRDGQVASDDDLMNSHNSTWSGSNLDAYSIIEPDSRPGSHSTSRSHSPLIVDIDPQPNEPSFHTPPAGSQQDLTAASLEQMQAEQASAGVRAASPTPTIRSMTRTLENDFLTQQRSEASPSYIADSRTPSQVASSSSRAISPFSELENVSAVGESDKESQWSDLGEDSSDEEENEGTAVTRLEEEEQQDLRDKRQRYFAALSTN